MIGMPGFFYICLHKGVYLALLYQKYKVDYVRELCLGALT